MVSVPFAGTVAASTCLERQVVRLGINNSAPLGGHHYLLAVVVAQQVDANAVLEKPVVENPREKISSEAKASQQSS